MNKEEAATELGISVRSLQRLAEQGKISKIQRRGNSGKLETFFNPEEIQNFKKQRDAETIIPAAVPVSDTSLARSDTQQQFIDVLRQAVAPEQKRNAVPVADKPLLKLDEAAALTGLSRDILRKSIDTGELKGKMIGRAYRIKRSDLDTFIEGL